MLPSLVMSDAYQAWHLCWEYPPYITGGLGVACHGLTEYFGERVTWRVFHSHSSSLIGSYHGYEQLGEEPISIDFDLLIENYELLGWKGIGGDLPEDLLVYTQSILAATPSSEVIIHGHDWHSVIAGVILKRTYNIPLILHLHSTQVERMGEHSRNWIRALEQWGIEQADKVICVSQISAASLKHNYQILDSKIHVCLNASDGAEITNSYNDDFRTLLFCGRLCSQKSPELVIELMRRLLIKYPELTMIMAGEGELLPQLRKVVQTLNLTDKICLFGKVPHAEMRTLYKRVNLLCMPSISEPFGLVALEAASEGLPVVISDRAGVTELLPSAIAVEHRDIDAWVRAISALIDHPELRRQLAQSIKEEAASRSWQDAASEVIAIYASLKN